jgi:hypothetical protein
MILGTTIPLYRDLIPPSSPIVKILNMETNLIGARVMLEKASLPQVTHFIIND